MFAAGPGACATKKRIRRTKEQIETDQQIMEKARAGEIAVSKALALMTTNTLSADDILNPKTRKRPFMHRRKKLDMYKLRAAAQGEAAQPLSDDQLAAMLYKTPSTRKYFEKKVCGDTAGGGARHGETTNTHLYHANSPRDSARITRYDYAGTTKNPASAPNTQRTTETHYELHSVYTHGTARGGGAGSRSDHATESYFDYVVESTFSSSNSPRLYGEFDDCSDYSDYSDYGRIREDDFGAPINNAHGAASHHITHTTIPDASNPRAFNLPVPNSTHQKLVEFAHQETAPDRCTFTPWKFTPFKLPPLRNHRVLLDSDSEDEAYYCYEKFESTFEKDIACVPMDFRENKNARGAQARSSPDMPSSDTAESAESTEFAEPGEAVDMDVDDNDEPLENGEDCLFETGEDNPELDYATSGCGVAEGDGGDTAESLEKEAHEDAVDDGASTAVVDAEAEKEGAESESTKDSGEMGEKDDAEDDIDASGSGAESDAECDADDDAEQAGSRASESENEDVVNTDAASHKKTKPHAVAKDISVPAAVAEAAKYILGQKASDVSMRDNIDCGIPLLQISVGADETHEDICVTHYATAQTAISGTKRVSDAASALGATIVGIDSSSVDADTVAVSFFKTHPSLRFLAGSKIRKQDVVVEGIQKKFGTKAVHDIQTPDALRTVVAKLVKKAVLPDFIDTVDDVVRTSTDTERATLEKAAVLFATQAVEAFCVMLSKA